MALVLDTGVLYASLDESDRHHSPCAELVATATEELVIPAPVLVELDYWVRKVATADAWLAFCEAVAGGAYRIHPLDAPLLGRAARVQARYADLGVGLVDAAVLATCEALAETRVATLDRRHFSILRTESGRALTLLPEPTAA